MKLLPLALLSACSDYGLGTKEPAPEGGAPDVAVSPGSVGAEGHCASASAEVVVTNEGNGLLEIRELTLDGQGWSMEPVELPKDLGAGESTIVLLTGTEGSATLTVSSNDADEPTLVVPLAAVANTGPIATITSPVASAVLAEGAELTLAGVVGDAEDAADTLAVTWSTDTAELASGLAESDGATGLTWAAADREGGPQAVTLTVTDACGQTASDTVAFCQDGANTYDAFDLSAWHFEGVAAYDATNGWLQLTDTSEDVVGSAFETSAPVDADHVDIAFLFYIGGGSGADGLSLTALDTTRMSAWLGGSGCGIGYGGDASCTAGPALPGWSLEVDTYYNPEADRTDADHLAFTFDGDVDGYSVYVEVPELEDTGWHEMTVQVVAPHVTVAIDGVTWIDQDISGNWAFPAYVGFTAGTGGYTNSHLIDALQVTDYLCAG